MSITGNLNTLELAELLQWLSQGTKSGVLVIQNGKLEKKIYFDAGKIIFSESNNPYEHLGSFLIREGLIDEPTLARAVKLQESTQILLGKVLVTLGSITENELHDILQRKTEESIYELFSWDEGDFHFLPDEVPEQAGVPLRLEVTNVVLEALRRLDESRHTGQPMVEDHSGRYSLEIEEVLNTELQRNSKPVESEQEELSDLPVLASEPTGTDAEQGSSISSAYGSSSSSTSNRTPLLAAAVAAIAIGGLGLAYFMFVRADPADGATEATVLESVAPSQIDSTTSGSLDARSHDSLSSVANGETFVTTPQIPDPNPDDEEMRQQYEAELAALRSEIAKVKQAETEARREAEDRVAVLEQRLQQPTPQEAETNDSESPDEPAPSEPMQIAQLGDLGQDSAGGDEPPSLSGSLQSLSSYPTPAATELAEELIEPAPDLLEDAELIAEIVPAEESNEPEVVAASVVEGELVEPGPTVNPPVMLTRPKPKYPQSALRLKRESEVTVRVLVDETGRVSRAERSGPKAGLGFDQAAIASAKQTLWQPATKEGVRVSMWVELKIHFRP